MNVNEIINKNAALKLILIDWRQSGPQRRWIMGETHIGEFATWEIGQDGSSNHGHYFKSAFAAEQNILVRIGAVNPEKAA